jgi:hypothetical protein
LPALGGESVAVLLASGSLSHHAITVSLAEYQQDDGATQVRVSADKVPPEARAILSRYRDLFA